MLKIINFPAMKKLYLILLLAVSFITVYAQRRSEADALSIANKFLNERNINVVSTNPVQLDRVYVQLESGSVKRSKSQIEESPAFYIYNKKDEAFVIVSGDERLPEVLAYSDSNAFGKDDLPDNVKAWLVYYENAYNAFEKGILKKDLLSKSEANMAESVSPLLGNINYDQSAPYNNMCPEYEGTKCFTGCVATAMATIMKYYEYPKQGIGSNSYTTRTYKLNCSFDFGNTTFDWDNMLDTYNGSETTVQKNAVATLMKACGVATNMDYTTYGSGTYSILVPERLIKFFGYNPNMMYIERDYYTTSEWIYLLKNELNEKRPVYYNGVSSTTGHAFVLDGYDKNGLFHVNWGWGGYCNGYFELLTLAPDDAGIGGGTDLDGYRFSQGMILNFQPETSENMPYYLTAAYLESEKENVSKGKAFNIHFNELFNNHKDLNYEIGILLEKDSQTRVLYSERIDIPLGAGWDTFTQAISIPNNCTDGIYKLYPATKSDGDTEWTKVRFLSYCADYLTVEVNGNNCKIYSGPNAISNISVEIVSDGRLTVGGKGDFAVTLENNGDKDFCGNLYMLLADESSENLITILNREVYIVEAGKSNTFNLSVDLKAVDEEGNEYDIPAGNYNLLMAYEYGQYFGTLENSCDITISGEPILEAIQYSLESGKVIKGDNIVLNATLQALEGNFEGYYTGIIFDGNYSEQLANTTINPINLRLGETQDVSVSYNTSGLAPGKYVIGLYYSKNRIEGYKMLVGYYFFVLEENAIDVDVSIVDLKTTLEQGEDATLTANFKTIGNGTFKGNLLASICKSSGDGTLEIVVPSEINPTPFEIGAGENRNESFTLSTSTLSPGEYFYVISFDDNIYLSAQITIIEPQPVLDFSEFRIKKFGLKSGEDIRFSGLLKNTGKGDFNGTCTLTISEGDFNKEEILDINVPANGEYDLSQLSINTTGIATGTYNLSIEFKNGENIVFANYDVVTIIEEGDSGVYLVNGSLNKEVFDEGDKIVFTGQAKILGEETYQGQYVGYIFDHKGVIRNSHIKTISIESSSTCELTVTLSTYGITPGYYVYVLYMLEGDAFVGKKRFAFEIVSGNQVSISLTESELSDTEVVKGEELLFTTTINNEGIGEFDGYYAGAFTEANSILEIFGYSNININGGESKNVEIHIPTGDLEPGIHTFSFLISYSEDEKYMQYYSYDIIVKEGIVSIGEVKEVNDPIVCSAPYEDNIRLISGVGIDRISVYDYIGNTVYSSDFNGVAGEITIPGGNIRGGIYILDITGTDNGRYVLKVVRD